MAKGKELKAGLGYMVGNMFIKGISFITLPIFTRLLTTNDFGIYNTYGAYESILAILLGVGMYSSIKNANYDYKDKLNTYVATLISILCCCSGGAMILGLLFHRVIKIATGFTVAIIILIVLQAFGTASLNIANAELSLRYDYKRYLIYAGINTIGNVALSLVLICTLFSNNRSVGRIMGSSLPLFGLGCWILYTYFKKANTKFDKGMAKYALVFGFPLVWHYLAQNVASQFDRIMITSMVGNSETGIYSFVYTIASIFSILFYSTDNVWSVWFYKKMEQKQYNEIRKQANKYIALFGSLGILMMLFSKEIIKLMSSRQYWAGADLFMPILVGLFFLFLYTIPVAIEYYYKETKYIAITTFVSAIANIILNYIFILLCGYKAAAYTTAASYFVMFIMHWIISKRIMKKYSDEELFKIKDFIKPIIMIICAAIIVMVLNNYLFVKYVIIVVLFITLIIKYKDVVKKIPELIKEKILK